MPFIVTFKNHEHVIVQGRAVVEQQKGKELSTLTVETVESMTTGLARILKDHPILSVSRLTTLKPGFNEIVWQSNAGDKQQVSAFSFDGDTGISEDRVLLTPVAARD